MDKKQKRQKMLEGFGKVLIDVGKLAIGGLVFGGIIRGELGIAALILSGSIVAGILIFMGLWLSTNE
jgi:hypothetical protein